MTTPSVDRVPRPVAIIAALSFGTALSGLNSGMIAVSLVALQSDFSLDVAGVTWVVSAYYLAYAALQPLMGRFADRFGPRKLFVCGMCAVIAAGALAPFSPTFEFVCVARVLLAVGTATAFPSANAMMRGVAERTGRSAPKMMGRIQMIDTGATALGPILGGVLISTLGWEAIFYVNVPLGLAAIIGTLLFAPTDEPRPHTSLAEVVRGTDLLGVVAFLVTIDALLVFLFDLPENPMWWLLAVVAAGGALFVWWELRATTPFIDLRILGENHALVRVFALFGLTTLMFYTALFGMPHFLESVGNYPTFIVGLLVAPLAAATIVLTPLVERLIERRGMQFVLTVGGFGFIAGSVALTALALTTSPVVALVLAALMGAPYCALVITLTQQLSLTARPENRGRAAGIFQTARSLGGITSAVIIGMAFGATPDAGSWVAVTVSLVAVAVAFTAIVLLWRPKAPAAA